MQRVLTQTDAEASPTFVLQPVPLCVAYVCILNAEHWTIGFHDE